jgi:hypothetical protein
MTQIVGKIVDSGGAPITGELVVTLDAPLVDVSTNPDQLYVLQPHTFSIVNGVLAGVNIVESQTKNITYHFTVNAFREEITYWLADGTQYMGPVVEHTDDNYYTGAFYDADTSQRLGRVAVNVPIPVLSFRAIVDNTDFVEFSSLIPTGVSRDTLPTTVRQVAELLTSNADFVEALRGGPRFKGVYSSTTYYQRDDAVTYAGSSWVYIHLDPKVGQTPSITNTQHWQILSEKGEPGGTGGDDTAYDATGWNGDTNAPSKNAVRDIIEQLARMAQLGDYAPLNGANFITTPNAPAPLLGASGTEMVNAAWVRSLFALINSPVFTGNPAAPTQSVTDASNKLATTLHVTNKLAVPAFAAVKTNDQTLTNNVANALNFNQEILDTNSAFDPATGTFAAPSDGWYEFHATARVERTSGTQINFFIGSIHVGVTEHRLWEAYVPTTGCFSGSAQLHLSAGQTAQFKLYIVSDGTVVNKNTFANIELTRFSGNKLYW